MGVHYFTLYDESALGRFDGENWNIGFLDVCNRPYEPLAAAAPQLISGSADLHGSTLNFIKSDKYFSAEHPAARNIRFGIREHAMGAVLNGLSLHGGVRPFGGTFLVAALPKHTVHGRAAVGSDEEYDIPPTRRAALQVAHKQRVAIPYDGMHAPAPRLEAQARAGLSDLPG